jgi:hypothetical protein
MIDTKLVEHEAAMYAWLQSAAAPDSGQQGGSYPTASKTRLVVHARVEVSEARIVEAVRPDGQPSSDHEALLVTIFPR